MTDVPVFQIIATLCAVASAVAAWVAIVRSKAKELADRVAKMETAMIASGVRLEAGDQLQARMSAVEQRMAAFENELKHVASTADVKGLQADMAGINRTVSNIQESTRRIENWLVESGR